MFDLEALPRVKVVIPLDLSLKSSFQRSYGHEKATEWAVALCLILLYFQTSKLGRVIWQNPAALPKMLPELGPAVLAYAPVAHPIAGLHRA
jgi:hypothetical protein